MRRLIAWCAWLGCALLAAAPVRAADVDLAARIVGLARLPGGAILAATAEKGGLYRSDDRGASWTPAGTALPELFITGLSAASGGTVWAATNAGIFRAEPGRPWVRLSKTPSMAAWPLPEGRVLARPWSAAPEILGDDGAFPLAGFEGRMSAFVATADGNRAWAGTLGGGVLRSDDGGRSWSVDSRGLANRFVLALALGADGGPLAGTLGGGVFRRDGGGEWRAAESGLPPLAEIQALAALPDGRIVAGSRAAGMFASADGGRTWSAVGGGDPALASVSALLPLEGGRVLAGTWGGGLRVVALDGKPVAPVALRHSVAALAIGADGGGFAGLDDGTVFQLPAAGGAWVAAGATPGGIEALLAPRGGGLVAGTRKGLFRSRDGGRTWERPDSDAPDARVTGLADVGAGSLLAATFDSGLLRSADGGATWRRVPPPVAEGYENLGAIVADGAGLVVVGASDGVLLSVDGGATWRAEEILYGIGALALGRGEVFLGRWAGPGLYRLRLPGGEAEEVAAWGEDSYLVRVGPLVVARDGALVAAGPDGVQRLAEVRGGGWKAERAVLPNVFVRALAARPNGALLAATDQGLFESRDGGRAWSPVRLGR